MYPEVSDKFTNDWSSRYIRNVISYAGTLADTEISECLNELPIDSDENGKDLSVKV